MIVLLKDIFKINENKKYKAGDEISHFSTEDEQALINAGLAESKKNKVLKPELKNKPGKKSKAK